MTGITYPTRRWSRAEYDLMIARGIFRPDERLELVGGELVVREPQGTPHTTGIRMAEEALRLAFGTGWEVRVQMPVALDDESEPEPDVTVVPGTFRDYRDAHPSRPALVVEVAQASLAFDRSQKASLYARAAVPDYWIVNLVDRVLEVHRDPVAASDASYGWRYGATRSLVAGDSVSPLAAPHARIPVADLLP
jgi:Uma2 family endonuclease